MVVSNNAIYKPGIINVSYINVSFVLKCVDIDGYNILCTLLPINNA